MAELPPPVAARPRRARRPFRWLAYAIAASIFILVAGVFALQTSQARAYVLTRVTDLLAQQGITFSAQDFDYNLLDLSTDLRDVRVVSPALPDGPPFLEVDSVRVDLSLWQVVRGRYVVQSAQATGVRVHYFVDATGLDNLPQPPTNPDDSSEPLDYLIADLRVPDAAVRYENRAEQIDLTIPRASLSITGSGLTNRHDVTLAAHGGTARVGERSATIDRLSADIDLGRDDATIERGEISAEGALVNVSGSIGPFAAPVLAINVQATADAARLSAVAQLAEPVGGQVSLDGRVSGPLTALAVDGQANGHNVQVRDLHNVAFQAEATYQPEQGTVEVTRLSVTSPHGAANGNGTATLRGTGASRVTASIEGLHAEPVMRALRLPYRAATQVDGQVAAEWPALEYSKATGSARLSLTPAVGAARSTLAVGGRIDIAGSGERVNATIRQLRAAGIDINGQIALRDRDRLSGVVTARADNVQTSIAAVETFLGRPRGSLAPMVVTGALWADGRIGGRIASPRVAATIAAPALTIGEASGLGMDGELIYQPEAVTIPRFDVAWQEARAHATGTIGLRGRQSIDMSVRAEAMQVAGVLRALERSDVPASGTVSASATVGGTLNSPLANFQVQATDLVAYNEVLGTLAADGRFANQQLDVTSLLLDKPQPGGNGRLSGTARYHLDREQFAVNVQSWNVELLTLTLPDAQAVTGAVEIRAYASGTVANPAGTIDLTADDLVVGAHKLGRIASNTRLEGGRATTTTTADRFSLTAQSTFGTASPYPATISATVDNFNLADSPVALQTPIEGRLQARLEATGDLTNWQNGHADASIEAFSGNWNQKPFAIDGPARLRYADERLTIDRLRVTAEDSTLTVSGHLPLRNGAAPGAIAVDATANLATLVQYAPAGTAIAADGTLTVAGTIVGTLSAIDPNLQIALTDALVLAPAIEPGISNMNATATIADGTATLREFTANWGTAQLAVSALVPLALLPELPEALARQDGPATFRARVDNLNPGSLPGAPQGLSGKLSLDAEVESPRPRLEDAVGKIAFRDLQLGFNGLTLGQKDSSSIAISDGIASIESLALAGSVGSISATGTVGLLGDQALNIDIDGAMNIAAIAIVTDRIRAEGDSIIDVSARGTVAKPVLGGTVSVSDGTVVLDEPRIAAEAIEARIELNQDRIALSSLSAGVNGGTVTGKGGLSIRGGTVSDVAAELTARDIAFDAPLDLRSLSDSDIRIRSQGDDLVVNGQVTIREAGLTGDINFDTGLLATITARRQLELTPQRNPLLERLLLDVNVDTALPILVDNNLARAEISTDLRVVGTPYETGLLGRLTVAEGGLVTLNERTYEIERGEITFIEDRRIYPSFNLSMTTTANDYDITLGVTGETGETETTLTSSPALPEPDIMALLITGRTLDQMRGEEYDVAREQVLSYLTGRVGSTLGRGLQRITGLSEVRIEPQLIANEANPGARLTLGQEIADDLSLTYSVDLADSNDQIWLATYDVTKRFQSRAVRQNDNSYRVDFRHDVRKGGRPEPRRQPRVRPVVAAVTVPDNAPIPAERLRDLLGVEAGDDFDYFSASDGVEDIEKELRELGWVQSRARLTRKVDAGGVSLVLTVTQGPQVAFSFEGVTPPDKVQDEVRLQWHRGVFDAQRTDDAAEAVLEWLMRDDYLQAQVSSRIDDSNPGMRRVHFTVAPGPQSRTVLLVFEGASGIDASDLDQVIDEQKLERQLFTDPTVVTELLQRLYREQGYLNAALDKPRYEFEGEVARVVLAVREGPRFTVSSVTMAGNKAIATPQLLVNLPTVEGDPFLPVAAENALQHIRDLYWERGYNEVRPQYQLTIDRASGRAGIAFTIDEGQQAIVTEIRIAGHDKTSERLVREQLIIAPAEPLNLKALSRSRKNLYDSGAFSIVDLSRDTIVEAAAAPGAAASDTARPVSVDVTVREVQPYQVRYGASYDTEGKLGGIVDASMHNVLGKARVLGMSARYDAQLREGRLYLSQPTLRHWPVQTLASLYYSEERNPATQVSNAFNIDRKGIAIQQEKMVKDSYVWTYGYRFEQARTFAPLLGAAPDEFIKVSPLTSTLVRDTRDEALDATRGSFSSQAVAFSPTWLGSDDTYMKYYGQYFHYFPLQPERRKRFSNEIIRPRLVFATAIRLGLSKGLGTFVPASERFFAGGSTSLRGFEQNAVGPIGPTGMPAGGDAMLVLNNELRAPLFSLVDGVGFIDIGNVWQRTSDFSLSDLRRTVGVGLRLRTKWVLVRGDYGFVLGARPGEQKGRFYFSIGQAF